MPAACRPCAAPAATATRIAAAVIASDRVLLADIDSPSLTNGGWPEYGSSGPNGLVRPVRVLGSSHRRGGEARMALTGHQEATELLMIEEADAWFEYLEAVRGQSALRYIEVEPWAWARLSQRLRAIKTRRAKLLPAAEAA